MSAPERNQTSSGKNAGTYIALFGLVIFGGLLGLLVTSIMPDAMRGFVVVFLLFSGMMCFHYFTWGRWMERTSRLAREREEREHQSPSGRGTGSRPE